MDYKKAYQYWLDDMYFDLGIHEELAQLKDDKEIEDRFYKYLDFGTGGLRGFIGAGTNRMNIYTVRRASQGVADYIKQTKFADDTSGIAIAYDSRRMSKKFAQEAACVFAANGIRANIFETLMPTPVLSYAVRHLKCAAGIVITASHNPKEYNGYKVYNSDGGQITDELAVEISMCISKVEPIGNIKTETFEKALAKGMVNYISGEVLDAYVKRVLELAGNTPISARDALKIVYSPLHGTGLIPVTRVLKEAGFSNVYVVKEQSMPDTEFSTVKSPNPEDHAALEMAISYAKEKDADIVIATDPDSDRLGIAVKNQQGSFDFLNGNQLGCLLLETILSSKADSGKLKPEDFIVKTIVTTHMAYEIARKFNVDVVDVLTGFKYIGEKIKESVSNGKGSFIFGFEESYGYLAGTFVRDKDAVIAALLTCEAAAICKANGQTLVEKLMSMYNNYGYYLESLKSYTFPGKDGSENIKKFMSSLRKGSSEKICGYKICAVSDYLESKRISPDGIIKIDLPKSNVLLFELQDGAWIAVRPSGTEPKLKIYAGIKGTSVEDSQAKMEALNKEIDALVQTV